LDRGPEISLLSPENGTAHNLMAPLAVSFETAPSLLADGDSQADISKVTLTVGGVEIETSGANGKYTATVDFTDKDLFGAAPTGKVPLVITAANKRKNPGNSTRSQAYEIVVDGAGPLITLTAPALGTVIGRAALLAFTVSDSGSGVDQAAVGVNVNSSLHLFSKTDNKWTVDTAGNYTFKVGGELSSASTDTQVTVIVEAKDKAGNASTGATRLYNLDTQPPFVDLDPPPLFETRAGTSADKLQCSDLFDALGESPNDKSGIVNFGDFRTLVWDRTNSKAGQSSVQLFVQTDTSKPLLYDATPDDGNSECNEIYSGVGTNQQLPTDKPLPFLLLAPITLGSRGAPSWGHSPPVGLGCEPASVSNALGLCKDNASDLSVVIRHDSGALEPVIYAVEPELQNTDLFCTGKPWEVSAAIKTQTSVEPKPGWLCVAARAEDRAGNVGVSPPLRVCLNLKDDGVDSCANIAPPTCTTGCTIPAHFPSRAVRHD
jgi:hypothetical protein